MQRNKHHIELGNESANSSGSAGRKTSVSDYDEPTRAEQQSKPNPEGKGRSSKFTTDTDYLDQVIISGDVYFQASDNH